MRVIDNILVAGIFLRNRSRGAINLTLSFLHSPSISLIFRQHFEIPHKEGISMALSVLLLAFE